MNFINVTEKEYNDNFNLNLDTVVAVYPDRGCVITNAVMVNEDGYTIQLIYSFDKENMDKIMNYINKDMTKKQPTLLCE